MSKIRLPWLWVVIGLELLIILSVLVWALAFRKPDAPTATKQQPTSQQKTPTYNEPKVELTKVVEGFTQPVTITSMPNHDDKRLFVVEQAGVIRIVTAERTVEAKAFLDIKPKVQAGGEMGLLGLAFHPKVKQNNFFYINYIDKDTNTIIARYTISQTTGLADPASEKVLLKLKQPYPNHNGGDIKFGPDSYLYIGLGDGGSGNDPENRAQNKEELLGKLLRIDVDGSLTYAVPADNPFAKGGGKPEIWALGLRNPWRFSFDRKNGDLYIADVGQGQYEEVNFQPANSKGGKNYGWRCYEGAQAHLPEGCQDASVYTKPILQYDHGDKRCSVTGGFVYRGSKYPALDGHYLYADFCTKQLFSTKKTGDSWSPITTTSTGLDISTFGEDSNGELYAADYNNGGIYQIVDTAN